MIEIGAGVVMFTVVVLALVVLILFARSKLVATGDVNILLNDDPSRTITTAAGGKLLNVLADNKIFVSSACGGGGTCAQCTVHVHDGGGDILPTELTHITRGQAREGMRLSCQVNVKQDMKVEVPAEVFSVRKWECEVVSNDNVATFIKELVLKLPEGENLNFESGGFIQLDVPPFECSFSEFDVDERFSRRLGSVQNLGSENHQQGERVQGLLDGQSSCRRQYRHAEHPYRLPPTRSGKGGLDGCQSGSGFVVRIQPQAG